MDKKEIRKLVFARRKAASDEQILIGSRAIFDRIRATEDYKKASPVMKACLVKAVNEDLQHLMPDVKQETLLVWGDNDLDTPVSDAQIMDELMPDSALVVIEGAGHYSFLEQPQLFRSILRSYLEADKKPARKKTGKSGGDKK